MTATVDRPRARAEARRTGRAWRFVVLPALATGLWVASLARTNVDAIGSLGLLSAFPLTMYVALAILVVSTALSIHRGAPTPVLAAHVVLFLLFVHGTPAVLYETLRYSWAWQHLGLVDYLARHHVVDPHVANLNAYQSWPGFFAVAATWLVGGHASSWVGPAQWAPFFFQVLDALVLYAIFETLDADRRVVWTGVWLFAVGNWIGQDYFSPQAFAFFLYLVVILLVVRSIGRRPAIPRFLARLSIKRSLTWQADAHVRALDHGSGPVAAVAMIALCTAAIASSHPLTPIVLAVSVTLLALARATTRRWLPFVVVPLVVAWMVTGALGYVRTTLPSLIEGLTTLGSTVDESLARTAHAGASQHLVSLVGRGEVVVVAVGALFGLVRRVRHGRWDATALVLALAPLAILAGGSYGGEAVFRVYLFALPFLALLAAGGCYPTTAHRGAGSVMLSLALGTAMLTGFMFGYFGKEQWTHFSPGELRAAETVFANAPPHSIVIDGTSDYPRSFANFENVTYLHLVSEPAGSVATVLAAPEPVLYSWLTDPRYARGYVIITRSQKAQADALGQLPRGALANIERALLASPRFTVVYHDADATVFSIAPPRVGTP